MRNCLLSLLFIAVLPMTGLVSSPALAQKKGKKLKAITPEKISLGRPVDFKKDVAPILEAKCIACHNVAIDEGKLSLEDVKSILKGGKRGPAVVPKQPDKSRMYLYASRGKNPVMPPLPNNVDATALTPKELGTFRQWILEGANAGSGSAATTIAWAPLPTTLNPTYAVALSKWGKYAVAGRANQVSVYDLAAGKVVGQLYDPALAPIQYEGRPMYPGGAAHRDFVHSLAVSPDGNLIASGGYRVVKLWQKQAGNKKFQVAAGNAVKTVAVSSDGKWLAIGAADNSIQIVDAKTGKTAKKLNGHSGAVNSVQFSADSAKLVSASADKTVRVWDVAKGNEIRKVASLAPVNQAIFNKDATEIITADADNTLRLWPVKKPEPKKDDKKDKKDDKKKPEAEKPIRELKGHSKPVTSVALILPQGSMVVSGSEDGTVRTWTLSNGRATRTMNHGAPVTAVAVNADGKLVASAGANGVGKIWQTSNGRQEAELKGDVTRIEKLAWLLEDQAVAKEVASDRGSTVKTAEKSLKDREEAVKKAKEAKEKADKAYAEAEKKAKPLLEKLAKAKEELAKKPKDKDLKKKVDQAEKAAAKPKAEFEKAKNTRDAADRALKLAEKSITRAKTRLDEAKKNETAAKARQKQADEAVKAAKESDKAAAKPMRSIAFSADGNTVVTSNDEGQLQLWSTKEGEPLETRQAHSAAIAAVTFGPNGTIITGSADKTAAVWSAQPAWKLVARLGTPQDKPLDISNSPFVARVLSLAFSRDGQLLATGGGDPSRSGELMIWNVKERKLLREIKDAHSDTVLGLEFNWDGTQILSGSSDKFAKIHDVATGKKIRSFEGHTHHVLDVSWQADGSVIATAGADNVIKVWNAKTGEQRRTISNYSKQVTSVQFIGTGGDVVTCAGDSQVNFHRTSNGQRYRRFNGPNDYVYASAAARSASSVVKSPTGSATVVIAGGENGVLRVWTGTAQALQTFEPPKPAGDKKQASVSSK